MVVLVLLYKKEGSKVFSFSLLSFLSYLHEKGRVNTQSEGNCWLARNQALTKSQICRHLDLGLPSLQKCEISMYTVLATHLWYFVAAAETKVVSLLNAQWSHTQALWYVEMTLKVENWPRIPAQSAFSWVILGTSLNPSELHFLYLWNEANNTSPVFPNQWDLGYERTLESIEGISGYG